MTTIEKLQDPETGLAGTLAEIQTILDQTRDPDGGLSHDEALAAIARLIRSESDQSPIYQKPLG